LIEGNSKKDESSWMGRNSQNKVIVFAKEHYDLKKGDYVNVTVTDCTKGTLLGVIEK
jgi:tRNA-2-methylthio-N6-dimethylallyladenosine synthase